jgi:hypothetical protein
MQVKFNVKGKVRKALATAISEVLNIPVCYNGTPTYSYSVGEYSIDREGTLTGEDNSDLITALTDRGFSGETEFSSDVDTVTIEYPLKGFTPESLDNLTKLVLSKEVLIKQALRTDELPIQVLDDRIAFPWFKYTDNASIMAYTQLITALCKTAQKKARVTAKPQESFENPRFSMRVWLISLGLIGAEFSTVRKIMVKPLPGDSSWRFGKPETASAEELADV